MPLVLQQDLATATNLFTAVADDESGAYQLGATRVLYLTVEKSGDRTSMQATLTDTATQRARQVIRVAGSASAGVVATANALAARLNARATQYSTKNDTALQDFVGAIGAQNLETRVQKLHAAIGADPGYGEAYIALAEVLSQAGQDPAPVLKNAASHADRFTPLDRARFRVLEGRTTHAPLRAQEQAIEAVLRLSPNEVDALAALGSARFLDGDAAGGERLLGRSLDLNPGNAALRQQLGVGLLETKQFASAEKVFQGIDNNAAVLPALATCVLLEGDAQRADAVIERYLGERPANDPVVPLLRASWLAISGRTARGIELAGSTTSSDPRLRSIGLSQMAIWQFMSGDGAGARRSAAGAVQLDPRPDAFAAIAAATIGEAAPNASWSAQVKQAVAGYSLFLSGRYGEAAQVWGRVLTQSGGTDVRARAMFAGALERAGQPGDAAKVPVEPFVPDLGDLYAAVSFGEMHRLIGVR